MKQKVLLIGLGPHSKRIYISGLKKLHLIPTVIVELESKRREVELFIKELSIPAEIFCIADADRDADFLAEKVQKNLDHLIIKHGITHAIISSEPKAHYGYLQYFITRRISVLTDKPITSPLHVVNDEEQAKKIHQQYHHLLALSEKYSTRVVVQCQRRYDPRYQWIASKVKELSEKYQLPVSHIQINHCDGSLNMPDEFFSRENHPYKYGYGKLFHSGYHFIDLLSFFLSYEGVPEHKRPTDCLISSTHYSPSDQLLSLDEHFYSHAFKHSGYSSFYELWKNKKYALMGELDVLALFEFTRDSHVITTCSLNLLQSGFSRRAWTQLPLDNYKGNGRIRHEMLNLQLGPLMNIQVHSYQAHEIKERGNMCIDHNGPGGLEHFDIHIFRNADLVGGPAHEIVKGKDLFPQDAGSSDNFMGFNEYARHECLQDFLQGKKNQSELRHQILTIDLVTHAYITMARRRCGEVPMSKCILTNQNFLKDEDCFYDSTELCSGIPCRS